MYHKYTNNKDKFLIYPIYWGNIDLYKNNCPFALGQGLPTEFSSKHTFKRSQVRAKFSSFITNVVKEINKELTKMPDSVDLDDIDIIEKKDEIINKHKPTVLKIL